MTTTKIGYGVGFKTSNGTDIGQISLTIPDANFPATEAKTWSAVVTPTTTSIFCSRDDYGRLSSFEVLDCDCNCNCDCSDTDSDSDGDAGI